MYALESHSVEADYGAAVLALRARQKKRALVVMFTDLSGERASESLLKYLPGLVPQHLPMLVTIRDPALDQEASQVPSNSDALYRRAVAEQLLDERRRLLNALEQRGVLTVDAGAVAALRRGSSLLPAGVVKVEGAFARGDAVIVRGPDGGEVGRGLVAYDIDDAERVRGKSTPDILTILGIGGRSVMVHRDDLVMSTE
jgi:glutamate 5-kinase